MSVDDNRITLFLVEWPGRGVRWCHLGDHPKTGESCWIDHLKHSALPYNDGKPVFHAQVRHLHDLLKEGIVPDSVRDLETAAATRTILDPTSDQGWLARDGTFYGCKFFAHDLIAYQLLHRHVGDLEYDGWIRVHADSYRMGEYSNRYPTKEQLDALGRLGFVAVPHETFGLKRVIPEADRTRPRRTFDPLGLLPSPAEARRARRDMAQ